MRRIQGTNPRTQRGETTNKSSLCTVAMEDIEGSMSPQMPSHKIDRRYVGEMEIMAHVDLACVDSQGNDLREIVRESRIDTPRRVKQTDIVPQSAQCTS